ncbi:MAG: hypothetical protein H0Z29_12110 [Candidatus Marinimicrobia bacterium]|nr:hypothetical protein [Candidatus Neomarinimicrobiota bacterium]
MVSLVIRLKPADTNIERNLLHIIGSKGKKDRDTILLDYSLKALKKYFKVYRPLA